ncbi:nicotinate (nicotinamide) nucleotide adenylyltransferase [Candidatus Pacearchaeota archaeon]|nr:nicotinate (nicotinamide) nucleotide adenylyltransferase [Candidatus Pacearchaeota archaeon]
MKIGIFGGSFNPIQNTHARIIKEVLKNKLVNEVWIVPSGNHPFDKKMESVEHRLKMINLAIKGIKNVKVCDIEINSNGKSYTYDTIKKLREKYPHEFLLIIGSDILRDIERWHKYKELVREVKFIIFLRDGYSIKLSGNFKDSYVIEENPNNISSSTIRRLASDGHSIKNLVPKEVEEYIKQKELYKNEK